MRLLRSYNNLQIIDEEYCIFFELLVRYWGRDGEGEEVWLEWGLVWMRQWLTSSQTMRACTYHCSRIDRFVRMLTTRTRAKSGFVEVSGSHCAACGYACCEGVCCVPFGTNSEKPGASEWKWVCMWAGPGNLPTHQPDKAVQTAAHWKSSLYCRQLHHH